MTQNIIVGLILLVAVVFLVLTARKKIKSKRCPCCGGPTCCSGKKNSKKILPGLARQDFFISSVSVSPGVRPASGPGNPGRFFSFPPAPPGFPGYSQNVQLPDGLTMEFLLTITLK